MDYMDLYVIVMCTPCVILALMYLKSKIKPKIIEIKTVEKVIEYVPIEVIKKEPPEIREVIKYVPVEVMVYPSGTPDEEVKDPIIQPYFIPFIKPSGILEKKSDPIQEAKLSKERYAKDIQYVFEKYKIGWLDKKKLVISILRSEALNEEESSE